MNDIKWPKYFKGMFRVKNGYAVHPNQKPPSDLWLFSQLLFSYQQKLYVKNSFTDLLFKEIEQRRKRKFKRELRQIINEETNQI